MLLPQLWPLLLSPLTIMKLKGLVPIGVKVIKNGDLVERYITHALGGGEWSIEAHVDDDPYSHCVKEWVGSNGTREPADDLWALVDEWAEQVHSKYKVFKAPDGTQGSYSFFMREARMGHLHGCILAL
jgi:hypothetical protein